MKAASPLQIAARKRNWKMAQLKTAFLTMSENLSRREQTTLTNLRDAAAVTIERRFQAEKLDIKINHAPPF